MKKLILLFILVPVMAFSQATETWRADNFRLPDLGTISKEDLFYLQNTDSNIQDQLDAHTGRLDTLEAETTIEEYADLASFPVTGEAAKAYLALDTNLMYRWNTSEYVLIGDGIGSQDITANSITISSTSKSSHPCPTMTDAEMLALVGMVDGDCVYNSTLENLMKYTASEMIWEEMGGAGGISEWETAKDYEIDEVVIADNRIYQALTDHTSATFTTDLANGDWVRINDDIILENENGLNLLAKTIRVPSNQLTQVSATGVRIETGNNNILANPSFEDAAPTTSWNVADASISVDTDDKIDGKQSLVLTYIGDPVNLYQSSTLYATAFADGVDGVNKIWVKNLGDFPLYQCPERAGVTALVADGKCVKIENNGKWFEAEISNPLGGTSNGLVLTSNGEFFTGVIKVDAAKVAPEKVKQGVDGTKIIGKLTFDESATTDADCAETPGVATWVLPDQTSCDELGVIDGNLSFESDNTKPSVMMQTKAGARYRVDVKDHIYKLTTTGGGACTSGISIDGGISVTEIRRVAVSVASTNNYSAGMSTSYFEFEGDGSEVNVRYMVSGTASTCEYMNRQTPFEILITEYPQSFDVNESQSNPNQISEVIFTGNPLPPTGFIPANNVTIGLTGATYNGTDYYALYETIWNMPGLQVAGTKGYSIASAKGVSASADWAAGKLITINLEDLYLRGASATNLAGAYQANQNLSHNHTVLGFNSGDGTSYGLGSSSGAGLAGRGTTSQNATFNVNTGGERFINLNGGTEARPETSVMYAHIRYQSPKIFGSFKDLDDHEAIYDEQSLGVTSGYQKFPGGLILQWGRKQLSATNNVKTTVTLPITYPNAILNVQATCELDNFGSERAVLGAARVSVSQIQIWQANSPSEWCHWTTLGY